MSTQKLPYRISELDILDYIILTITINMTNTPGHMTGYNIILVAVAL